MDKHSFLKETHDYLDECYKKFESYQEITWDILCHINKLFRENDIEYFLAYGTLLGAVRDKGNIPWDYDVDIHIKINNYEKLLHVLDTKLGENYYYVFTNNMKDYPAECLRICKKGYTYMSFHVDVFFLIGGEPSREQRISTLKWIKRLTVTRINKFSHRHLPPVSDNRIKVFLYNIYYGLFDFVPVSFIKRKENQLYFKNNIENSDEYISYTLDVNWGDKEFAVFPARIFEPIDYQIGNETFIIPKGYEEYLTIEYGDWKSYLPIKTRFDEYYAQLDRIRRRQEFYLKQIQ